MSLFDVAVSFAAPDPDECPQTFSENVALLNQLVDAEIVGNFIAYLRQSNTPSVEQQNLIWHKIDVDGRPIGTFHFYGGVWRREYSGRQDEIRYFSGDPAIHFESNGRGIVGGEWDGFALCNGNNGTPNLTDRFIVVGKLDDLGTGYNDNVWKTTIDGSAEAIGGEKEITLTDATTFRAVKEAVTLFRRTADSEAPSGSGGLFGLGPLGETTLIAADAGNDPPDAISIIPWFYALAITKWIGY